MEAERRRQSYLNPTDQMVEMMEMIEIREMVSQMAWMEIRESKWICFISPLKSYTLASITEYFRLVRY